MTGAETNQAEDSYGERDEEINQELSNKEENQNNRVIGFPGHPRDDPHESSLQKDTKEEANSGSVLEEVHREPAPIRHKK